MRIHHLKQKMGWVLVTLLIGIAYVLGFIGVILASLSVLFLAPLAKYCGHKLTFKWEGK